MTRRRKTFTYCMAVLGALYWGCPGPVQHVDRGGSEVVGKTVAKSGAPIASAQVTAFRLHGSTYDSVAAVRSGRDGSFTFVDLDTGTYKLYGTAVQGDTLVGLKENVVVSRIAPRGEPPSRTDAGMLELKPRGWISGTVIIDKDDKSGVLCYTRDSAFIALSREDGSFTIPRVAEGTYTVCFFYQGYLPKRIEGVSVVSGSGTTMEPVYLDLDPTDAPNPPKNLFASYDTARGMVTVRWNRVRVADLREYIVYRKNSGSAGSPEPIDTVRGDTAIIDTVFRVDTDTVPKSLLYQVRAVDSADNQSIFSDPVTVLAIPPSRIRPVVRGIASDTVVEYGGSIRCRIAFINAFNNYQVYLMPRSGGSWVAVSHSAEGISDTAIAAGTQCTWGSVRYRVKFGVDSLDTSFTVRIRPRQVAVVSTDSTDSTITLRWNRTPDDDFKEYMIYRNDSVLSRLSRAGDTTWTWRTLSVAPALYWIAVTDTEGVTSRLDSGKARSARIINTPPRFTTTPATLLDSALIGEEYRITLAASDRNGDAMTYTVVAPARATFHNNTLIWTPTIEEAGMQRCTVTVRDVWGGADTLTWNLRVYAHSLWMAADSLIGARRQCGIASISGMICVVGGSVNKVNTTQPVALKTVEVYDTVTGTWVARAPMANARFAPFVGVYGGKLYVMGGRSERSYAVASIEEYDPVANTWTTIGQMPGARAFGAACVIGSRMYCIGGKVYDTAKKSDVIVKAIDIFDLATRTWQKGPSLLNARADHQAVVYNNRIYVVGGYGGRVDSILVNDNVEIMLVAIESFAPAASRCDSVAALATPRSHFAAALLGPTLYCIGGFRSLTEIDNAVLAEMETINLATGDRITGLPLAEPRHSAAAIGRQGMLFYIGGVTGTTTTGSVYVYYP